METQMNAEDINCESAAQDISALHDGDQVSPAAARHIASCPACQERARDYSAIKTELRLSALRQSLEPPPIPSLPRKSSSHHFRAFSLLSGRTVMPRAIAALAALVIVALSVSLALVVHAQTDGPWVQYSISMIVPQDQGQRETGFLQSPSMPRGAWVMHGPSQTLGYTLRTIAVRDGRAQLEIAVRGFRGFVDYDTALSVVKSSPTVRYWYTPGQVLDIPVEGICSLRIEAHISETQPALSAWARKPVGQDTLRLDRPVVLRGKEVICEGAGGTVAAEAGPGGALEYYVPGEGMFIVSLVHLPNAIEGVVDGSIIQFGEGGREFRIFSHQAITAGDEPRPIWIQHDSLYRPQDDTPSLTAVGGVGIKK